MYTHNAHTRTHTHTHMHTHTHTVVPSVSDTEEEVDFGYWEKASVPTDQKHSKKEGRLREVDLNLL